MKTSMAGRDEGEQQPQPFSCFVAAVLCVFWPPGGRNVFGCQKCGARGQKESRPIRLLLLCGLFCTGPPLCRLLDA